MARSSWCSHVVIMALVLFPAAVSAQESEQAEESEQSEAQPTSRSANARARMELTFHHGYGFSTEGDYIELAIDYRIYAPVGFGVVLRTGVALQGLANAMAMDLGIAYRAGLGLGDENGVSFALAVGPSIAYGPFDRGDVVAYGGFADVHVDYWYRNVFIGIGVTGHALISERHEDIDNTFGDSRGDDPILSIAPMLRFGGDWSL